MSLDAEPRRQVAGGKYALNGSEPDQHDRSFALSVVAGGSLRALTGVAPDIAEIEGVAGVRVGGRALIVHMQDGACARCAYREAWALAARAQERARVK